MLGGGVGLVCAKTTRAQASPSTPSWRLIPTIPVPPPAARWLGDMISSVRHIAQLPDGTYYVSLTATTVDDEEPQLLNQEIDSRRGVSLEEVLALIKNGLTSST